LKEKDHLQDLVTDENIKMDFTEISWDFSDGFIWLRKGTVREC
jgi:hypothetical protein